MLWPYGQIYNNGNEDWSGYIALSKQAITATRETTPEAQIIIHHAGIDTAPYFYEQIADRNLDFDMIGLSYYPWWHGDDVSSLSRKLTSLHSENLDKKIMVVETAYPFTLDWNDNLNNIIGLPSQAAPDYPATPVGQAKFLRDIRKAVQSLPNDAGAGFCYWAPEWVAYPSSSYSFMQGSSWENLALFGFDGVELEGMGVFAE
jgi:arabinogalactan endo-1,4-beta-galactosidase